MRSLVSSMAVALVCGLSCVAAQALELAKYPKVFSGAQGVEVAVAPTVDGKQALLRVSGVNTPIDKVVFLSTLESRGNGREVYNLPLDGRSYGLLHKRSSAYHAGEQFEAYLPGKRDAVALSYDEKKSKALKVSELQADYDRQSKQGVQEKLARFDRAKRLVTSQDELALIDKEAAAACGIPVKTTVDWKAIDDDKLQNLSVASFCGAVASELGTLCSNTPAFKAKAAALAQVQCHFGPELKIRAENQQVVFSTEKDAPNQGDFVRQFLRNQ